MKRGRPHAIPKAVRAAVLERDDYSCRVCGYYVGSGDLAQLHHKLKRSQGGQDTAENLITVDPICHADIEDNPKWAVEQGYSVQLGKVAA